ALRDARPARGPVAGGEDHRFAARERDHMRGGLGARPLLHQDELAARAGRLGGPPKHRELEGVTTCAAAWARGRCSPRTNSPPAKSASGSLRSTVSWSGNATFPTRAWGRQVDAPVVEWEA